MLVYGDRSETVDPRAYGEALVARCDEVAAWAPGHAKTAAVMETLIAAGKLVQGLADAAFEADGCERWDFPQKLALRATIQIGLHANVCWNAYGDPDARNRFSSLLALSLGEEAPEAVTLREPEGYAFYAVYPQLYLEAGEGWPPRHPRVIGVRSIGASLGAAASASFDALTLRPSGDPFARELRLGAAMKAALLAPAPEGYLVVDEGPGASGSSFGVVGDVLEDAGVAAEAITYMPSHLGDLGPHASGRHRARWRSARKLHASFEDVILPRLPVWVEPLIGPLAEPLADLSGGRWREVTSVDAPAWPEQERRKYLAATREGRFLLRFAGLGGVAERKFARAKALHAAGFSPEPVGLAHGFLVERWVDAPALAPAEGDVERVGRYLGFRARSLQPPHGAASDEILRTMMRRNFALADLPELADQAGALPAGERGPPCAVDGRLHAWEWRRLAGGRLLKLDALDHCEGHDLVGAQDAAWDLAGAAAELDLAPEAAERLRRIVAAEGAQAIDPRRIDFQTLAYLAFQIGWWTFAAQGCEGGRARDRARVYARRAAQWRPLA